MKNGFTLLEVIIAITVITAGLAGALVLIGHSIASATAVRDRLVAVNLAQEGVEVVRNIRDSNWLAGRNWDIGFFYTTNTNVDWDSTVLDDVNDGLSFDGAQNHYIHSSTPNTPFKRHIELNPGPEVMQVKSIVEWSRRGGDHRVELEAYLYDWK